MYFLISFEWMNIRHKIRLFWHNIARQLSLSSWNWIQFLKSTWSTNLILYHCIQPSVSLYGNINVYHLKQFIEVCYIIRKDNVQVTNTQSKEVMLQVWMMISFFERKLVECIHLQKETFDDRSHYHPLMRGFSQIFWSILFKARINLNFFLTISWLRKCLWHLRNDR